MSAEKFGRMLDAIRQGETRDMQAACQEAVLAWRDIPVEPLLAMKGQFQRMDLEQREANLDEALVSVAEKRPEPFAAVASDPESPLWRAAVEVLSMIDARRHLELFISLLPGCPRKNLETLIRAIGRYRDPAVADALRAYLSDPDEGILYETVLAIKKSGEPEALAWLRENLARRVMSGSGRPSIMEAVIREMETGEGAA